MLLDETYWCVFNDGLPANQRRWQAEPQGIEIRQTIFAAATTGALGKSIFVRYRIKNTGTVSDTLKDLFFSMWADADIGDATDDVYGCDTMRQGVFFYNNTPDAVYGDQVPSFMMDMLTGPRSYIPGITFIDVNGNNIYENGIDTPLDTATNFLGSLGIRIFPGAKNLASSSCITSLKNSPGYSDPNDMVEVRNYSTGLNQAGQLLDPCTWPFGEVLGVPCAQVNPYYWCSGDPVGNPGIGWLLTVNRDLRGLGSAGPFNLAKDQEVEILIGYEIDRGSTPLGGITAVRNVSDAIQTFYENNFGYPIVSVDDEIPLVLEFKLEQNYPNPFNPSTKIKFSILSVVASEAKQSQLVTLKVYDVLGNEITTLVNEELSSGSHEVSFDASTFPSGIYFYTLQCRRIYSNKKNGTFTLKLWRRGLLKLEKKLMKKFTTILIFCLIPIISYSQWYDLPNVPHGRCNAIDAVDSLIVTGAYRTNSSYIPDSLYMTTDGGDFWFAIPLPNSLEPGDGPMDICIKDANKLWFCSGNGKIFKTTDAGANWQLQFYDTLMTKFMNYLEMFDEMNGMAMGDAPANDKPALFLKTTNGGQDWISQNDSELIGLHSGETWRRVDFANTDVGYFYTFSAFPPTIYKTTNSGKNWEVINDSIRYWVLKAYDENILLVEYYNNVYQTLDGGQTWESNQYNFLDYSLDIEFIPGNPSNVWCGLESVNFSSDTGKTWVNEFNFINGEGVLYDMVFTDENSGWIYAGGGGILTNMYRTTNGGHGGIVSVDNDNQNLLPAEFKLEQNYPNPFNPSTKIKFTIPNVIASGAKQSQLVTLKVYDILGNEIAILVNEELSPGEYEVEFNGHSGEVRNLPAGRQGLTSGIYFYSLRAGELIQTRKMILMK